MLSEDLKICMIVLFTPGDHNSTLYNCSKIRAMKRDIECHKDSNASFLSPIGLRGVAQIIVQQLVSEPRTWV